MPGTAAQHRQPQTSGAKAAFRHPNFKRYSQGRTGLIWRQNVVSRSISEATDSHDEKPVVQRASIETTLGMGLVTARHEDADAAIVRHDDAAQRRSGRLQDGAVRATQRPAAATAFIVVATSSLPPL
ncbi:hypothetical protein [Sphingomonas sp. Leaf67]|uniref:hypothetical protein n=1 Tax=Sphingomonas sp. Leaf67 TaxID=1736230 RepID=UPI000A87486D|nr:hypothetical protein [Sphingomonas sp. Leaf67]